MTGAKVTARVDVGPVPVDVDWGDGTSERGVKGALQHDYPAGVTVDITVTDPTTGLKATSKVHVPGAPRTPQVSFDDGSAKQQHHAAPPAGKKSKSEGGSS